MVIRKEQLDRFDELAEETFHASVRSHIRGTYTERVSGYDEDLLRELVSAGIARGRKHGLTWESSLIDFVSVMFAIAPNFDQHPKASALLGSGIMPADVRMTELFEQMTESDWQEAARASATSEWFRG